MAVSHVCSTTNKGKCCGLEKKRLEKLLLLFFFIITIESVKKKGKSQKLEPNY